MKQDTASEDYSGYCRYCVVTHSIILLGPDFACIVIVMPLLHVHLFLLLALLSSVLFPIMYIPCQ